MYTIDKHLQRLLALMLPAMLVGCSATDDDAPDADADVVAVRMSVLPFEGEPLTRTTMDGLGFEDGESLRMKIICPHTSDHQTGEQWGSGYYTFSMSFDGDTYVSGGQSVEAQATTYIYTAQNTTGIRNFVVNNVRYSRPSNFFCADQSKAERFKRSDVVWAQGVRQTGAKEVHLWFRHKVARLDITVDDAALTHEVEGVKQPWPLSSDAVLTIEGMPDIDGAEIVVGDYYADECYESESYNYREKASCSYENNGRVLGVEFLEEGEYKRSSIMSMTGNPTPGGGNSRVYGTVPNTATYTALRDISKAKHYMLYVPPCVLDKKAVVWLRDGERRYSAILGITKFEEGTCYPVKVVLSGQGEAQNP